MRQEVKFIFIIIVTILFFLFGEFGAKYYLNKNPTNYNTHARTNLLTRLANYYNSSHVDVELEYKGILKKMVDNKIILTSSDGQENIIPINEVMWGIAKYSIQTNRPNITSADRKDFVPGKKVTIRIVSSWVEKKITGFILKLEK